MTSNELADWMEKNNIPALLTHYIHGVKDRRHYGPFKGLVDTGEAIMKVTFKNRNLTFEATETFEAELNDAKKQIASLKEKIEDAQTELNSAKRTVKAQEKEIAKLTEAVETAEAEVKKLKAEAKKKAKVVITRPATDPRK